MRRVLVLSIFTFCLAVNVNAQSPKPTAKAQATPPVSNASASPAALNAARASFAKLPLSFEENAGQTDSRVKYTSRGPGYNLFLTADEAVFALRGGKTPANCSSLNQKIPADCTDSARNSGESSVLWLKMLGANASARVAGADPLPGKINYYIGNNPSKWRTGVRQYGRVSYSGIYPGIDLTYYGNQQQLESDFIVAPGTSPRSIEFEIKGARETRLDPQGNLVLVTSAGNVQLLRPGIYQTIKGARRDVSGSYVLRGQNRIGFAVGSYDRREKLIIDPTLVYSTFLGGGSLFSSDAAQAIAIDSAGHAYVTGQGGSADFPGSDIAGPPVGGLSNFVFITEFDVNGSSGSTALIYSTILSGSKNSFGNATVGNGIGVDISGNAYVAGVTSAADFPMVNPFQATYGSPSQTGFVAGLASATGALTYSTYLGGRNTNDSSELQGLFADSAGNAYVVGDTISPNFPTVNPLQATLNGSENVVVAKFNNQGQPVYSTYLGGNGFDLGTAITVDSTGSAYFTGNTSSTNFPLQSSPAPFQNMLAGGQNVFISKLTFSGSTLTLAGSTYLGGSSTDQGMGIAVDTATPPNVYVTGQTTSSGAAPNGFPTTVGAFSTAYSGSTDAFVTKLKGDFSALSYSTYLGGTGTDVGNAIGLDGTGNAYITGSTTSANFPTKNPFQSTLGSPINILTGSGDTPDAFIAQLNPSGSGLTYSTYFGGVGSDMALGIAVDAAGNAYIAGQTTSPNFPVMSGGTAGTSPFQGQLGSSTGNAFVAKISPAPATSALNFFPASYNFHDAGIGASLLENVTLSNNTSSSAAVSGFVFGGANSGDFTLQAAAAPCTVSGAFAMPAGSSCVLTVKFTPMDQDARSATLTVNYNSTFSSVMNLSGNGGAPEVSLSTTSINFGNDPLNVIAFGGVTVTNTGGGPLQIGSAQIQASTPTIAAQFSLPTSNSSCFTAPIATGSSCSIDVDFNPNAGVPLPGTAYSATLLINSNAAGSPATLTLAGTAVQEVIVQPVSLELGIQIVGSTSTENQNEAFLVNGSGEAINITVTPGAGADQGDFHINNTIGGFTACATVGSLAPGGTCSLFVYFQPAAVSATDGRTGSYTISWTGTAAPSVVPGSQVENVMGTGITGISLYKNSIVGPNEYVGFTESSAGLEFLANGTPNPITVTIALTGNNPGDFAAALDSLCAPGGVIPANTYCRADLSFTPSAIGLRTATVAFNYTGVSNGQLLLSASGTGIPGPVFVETATQYGFLQQVSSFDFGSEIISTTTPEKKFLIRNAATTPLTVQSITGPGNADFKITPDSTCGATNFTIKGGSSCSIGVTFTPSSTGAKESTSIVITDAYTSTNGMDAGSPHTLTLNGTGELAKITVSVTNGSANFLDFGNVALNPSPVPQAAIYLANAGNAPTTITWAGSSPALAAGSNAAFGLVASGANITTCTQNKVVLPQGGSCLIGVTFNPTAAGPLTASVIFSDSVGGSHTVNIQGNAVGQGQLSLSTFSPTFASLTFAQLAGTTSSAQTATVTNLGSGPLTITSLFSSGTNISNFTILPSSTCAVGTVIPSGATGNTCVFNVTFTAPMTTGFSTEYLSIQANLGNNALSFATLQFSGSSLAGGFSLSPAGPITFGTVPIGSTVTTSFYTLTNENPTAVTFGAILLPAGYAIVPFNDSCSGKVVASFNDCFFQISFTPTSAISFNGNLSLPYTGPTGSPYTVAVQGTGSAAVTANPNPLKFQAFAGSTAFQNITIGNGSSSAATITGVSSFTGANAADFSVPAFGDQCFSSGVGAVLTATGGTCSISINFLSPTAGTFTAQFTVSYSIGSVAQTPITVTLNATILGALVTVTPSPVVFASQTVNTQSQTMNVTLINSASATQALSISTIQISGNDFASFTPGGGNCFSIAAGKSCTVQVAFTPSAAGARTGTLTITDNSTTSPHVVNLQGMGIAGSVSASPSSLTFPLTTDFTSVTEGAVLSNTLGSTITVNSVVFSGPYATDIGSGTCVNGNKISAVTGTCVVYIKFTPNGVSNPGTATVNYTIGAGPATGSVVITLSGAGTNPSINVNPTSLVFSSQTVGSSSAAQPVTLSNPTSIAASVSGTPSITGTNASDFTLGTNSCTSGASLPATTGSCIVNVIFKPGASGGTSRAATLSISDSPDSSSPHIVSLSGTAIQPVAGLSGTTLAFGNLDTGVTSGQQTVTLTNTGNASMTVSSVILGGTNAGDFAQVTPSSGTDCRTVGTLAAGASCNVAATFTPTATGSGSATITITDNANPATQVISLTGNGTQPGVGLLPTTIAFGNQLLSTTSAQSTSTLTNSGTGPLTITAVTLGGTNQGDFALVAPASGTDCRTVGTVAAAGTCVIAATFTPSALGGRSATISVTDNASGSPHSLPLTGAGVFPQAAPTPSPVAFGNQILNVASAAQTLTLTNGGTATLNLTTVALGGTNANQFAIATGTTCTNGSTVAASGTCVVKLTFTPTALGNQTATVTFTDNASPTTQVVNITGTGVFPQATPSPSPVAFGNQRDNTTSAAQTLTLTNGGTGILNLTTVALGGTNANQFAIATGTTCTNGSTVAAGGTCVVKLTFTPTALGGQSATITFTDNASPTTQVVNITGTGVFPQASPAPTTVAFGSQTNGIASGPHTITLTNGGTGTLDLTTVALGGTNPSVFAIVPGTTTCTNGSTIAAGASCVVNVTFTPSGLTSFSATLTFTDDATPTTQVVNLTGTGVTSTVNFSPSTVAFPNQRQGTTSTQMISTLTNSGSAPLSISGIAITGTNLSDFTLVAPASGTPCPVSGQVAAGASCTIAATFTPSALGGRSATVSVTDNASGSPHSLPLTGTGVFPQATPTPSPVAFGNQILNVASAAQTLTLTNGGTATLNLTTVALGGTNANQFAIATGTTCTNGSTVASGATCVVKLTFTPTALGSQAATVTFTDDASPATQVVNITGTGVFPQATPSPSPVAFGNQRQNTTSAAQTLTLTNGGTGILNLTTVALGGTNANQFAIATGTTCTNGSTVAAGATCVVKLIFTPTVLGGQTATITFTDNANPTTQVVNLTGTGTFPQASPAPATVPFGSQTNGIASGPRTVTLTNGGTGTLNLTTVALGGTNPSVFAIASGTTCTNGSTIAGGGSCIVNVAFTPSGLTSFSATLTFTDDATPTTQVVNLTGTGVTSTVNFSPSTVAFPNQRQGTTSTQMISTLTNSGSAPLSISGIAITGTNLSDFTLVAPASGTPCPVSGQVAAGASCTIAATFTPSALGGRSATVSVTDNASGSPHTFALTGTGTASAVTLSTSTVTFANQIQTTTSSAQTITVTNSGTATLNISTVALGGTNPSDFAISGTGTTCVGGVVGFTAPNNTCTITVTFTPATANAFTATLTITDDATPTTQVVNLSGTGVTPPTATPTPTSLTFPGQATTTTSAAQTITLSNNGGAPLSITSIAFAGTNPGDFKFASPATTCPTSASGQVAAGASCVLSVTFTPTAIGARTANIAITVTGIANPAAIALSGTGTAPDLAISKKHLASSFEVGVNNNYAIKLTNNGTAATQQQITVTDTLPAGLTFVSGGPAGWTCSAGAQNAQIVTCTNAGPIAVGASSTLTLTVSVASVAFPSVTNSATVADAGDSGITDKSATDSPTAVTAPDVTITKTHPSVDFLVGSMGIYTIKVTNNGSGATTGNITVTDTLPTGLTFVSNTGAGWACAANAQNAKTVVCTYTSAPLAAAGGTSSFTLTVSVAPGAFPSVTNMATVADPNDGRSTDKSATDSPTNIDNVVPTQSAFSPTLGLIAGATSAQQITITGTGLNASTIVTLGSTAPLNTPLTGTASADGTSLVISVPAAELVAANAGNLTITVTNPKNPTSNAGGGVAATTLKLPLVGLSSLTPPTGTPNPIPVVAGTPFALTMNLNLTPSGATLPADVTITCSLPTALTGATCTPSPSTIAHGTAAGAATTVVTINAVPTKKGSAGPSLPLPRIGGQGPWSTYTLWLLATVLLSMLGMLGAVRQRAEQFRRVPMYLTLALLVLAAGALVGCTTASGPTPTPTGPSTVTVTATTADGATVSSTVNIIVSN